MEMTSALTHKIKAAFCNGIFVALETYNVCEHVR